MSFIPDTINETTAGGYFKPVKGKPNKVRIISDKPVVGWVQWTAEGRPARFVNLADKPDVEYQEGTKPKRFLAMAVYSYELGQVQVWEMTQKTMIEQLNSISTDSDFGHPNNYDLKVNRTGEGLDTSYTLIPVVTDLQPEVMEAMQDPGVDLHKLFLGEDPFE